MHEYAVSKLGNVLFTPGLARRTAGTGVNTYALHPGVVASDIWRRVPWPVGPLVTRRMLSVTEGAETSLYCATSAEVATRRAVLRQVRAAGAQPGGDALGRATMEAQ